MGSWGLTNLQNDIAEDVKSDYISLLQKGKTGEEATKELTLQYEDAIWATTEYNIVKGCEITYGVVSQNGYIRFLP